MKLPGVDRSPGLSPAACHRVSPSKGYHGNESALGAAAAGGAGLLGQQQQQQGMSEEAFGDAPTQIVCPHCSKAVTTTVRYKRSCVGMSSCAAACLLLGWPGLCLGPFLWVALRDAVHECPQCLNQIWRRSRVSCPLVGGDRILTLRCGSCALVLTRRYFVCFLAVFFVVLLCHLFRGGLFDSTLRHLSKGEPTSLGWLDFVRLCGQRSQLGNPLKAAANFSDNFALRTVAWKGLVKQVREGLFPGSASFVFLAMNPTLSASRSSAAAAAAEREEPLGVGELEEEGGRGAAENQERGDSELEALSELERLQREEEGMAGDGADLGLAFSQDLAAQVAKLNPGDKVAFEATLHELGRRGKPTLGRLWSVQLVEPWSSREQRLKQAAAAAATVVDSLLPDMLFGGASGGFLMGLGGPFGSPFGGLSLPSPMLGRGVVVIRSTTIGRDGEVLGEKIWRGGGDDPSDSQPGVLQQQQEPQGLFHLGGASEQGLLGADAGNGSGSVGAISLLRELLRAQQEEDDDDDDDLGRIPALQRLFSMHGGGFGGSGAAGDNDDEEEEDEADSAAEDAHETAAATQQQDKAAAAAAEQQDKAAAAAAEQQGKAAAAAAESPKTPSHKTAAYAADLDSYYALPPRGAAPEEASQQQQQQEQHTQQQAQQQKQPPKAQQQKQPQKAQQQQPKQQQQTQLPTSQPEQAAGLPAGEQQQKQQPNQQEVPPQPPQQQP
ncbi:hypothetical protein Esti_003669 [Eimeria stiedai]